MKLFKPFYVFALSGMLMAGFTACGDDDNEGPGGDDPIVEPGQVDDSVNHPLTSTEAGNYLDETASQVYNLFNPNDQKEVVDVFNNYVEKYGDYEFDGDMFDFVSGGKSMLTNMARSFAIGLSTGDLGNLSRAANAFVTRYDISFDKIKGIYTPDTRNETWRRDPSGNDVVFRFGTTEVVVKVSGGNWDMEIADEDWDYEWSGDGYDEVIYEYQYYISVPKNIVVTVTDSGKELVRSVVETNLDTKGKTFHIKTNLRAANITADILIDGNNSLVTESESLFVGGERLVASTASINGSRLCDVEYLSELFDYDEIEDVKGKIDSTFGNGEASVNIYDRVQINAQFSKIGTIMAASDYDGYVYGSYGASAESDAENFASVLNSNMKANMSFGNTSVAQANILWQKYYDEYYPGSGEWFVEPVMVFVEDNSRFTFEEYFNEGRFVNVETKFASLLDLYASLWK